MGLIMNSSDDIYRAINLLDARIQKIEEFLSLNSDREESESVAISFKEKEEKPNKSLELQLGKFWLARIGILIFAVGLIFLISSSFESMPGFFPSLLGYVFSALFFSAHIFGKKWLSLIDNYILSVAFILLFFSTLRLSYFSSNIFINNITVEVLILFGVCIISLVYALRKESVILASLSILFCFITTLTISSYSAAMLCSLLLPIVIVWVVRKFKWQLILFFGIILSYSTYSVWFVGNPLLLTGGTGNNLPNISVFFILGSFIIYTLGLVNKEKEEFLKISSVSINSIFAVSLFIISTYAITKENLSLFSFIAFIVFLLSAILTWTIEKSKYATFFYSILGYMLLSISIISGFQKPDYFILLGWQSLLVVSTAVWFRSRIIIVANFIIYLLIFFSFLFLASKVTYISISFGIVALLSARFLNWKKKQLNLNSEGMRNAYLICAFFIFPYSLYNSVPEGFVTISWIGVAVLYYILSVLLKNIKYRWLALSTLMLSVGYAILFGISELSSELRILTFLVLGIVLLVISLLYSKKKNETLEQLQGEIEEQ